MTFERQFPFHKSLYSTADLSHNWVLAYHAYQWFKLGTLVPVQLTNKQTTFIIILNPPFTHAGRSTLATPSAHAQRRIQDLSVGGAYESPPQAKKILRTSVLMHSRNKNIGFAPIGFIVINYLKYMSAWMHSLYISESDRCVHWFLFLINYGQIKIQDHVPVSSVGTSPAFTGEWWCTEGDNIWQR
jgi:hypothetical protein